MGQKMTLAIFRQHDYRHVVEFKRRNVHFIGYLAFVPHMIVKPMEFPQYCILITIFPAMPMGEHIFWGYTIAKSWRKSSCTSIIAGVNNQTNRSPMSWIGCKEIIGRKWGCLIIKQIKWIFHDNSKYIKCIDSQGLNSILVIPIHRSILVEDIIFLYKRTRKCSFSEAYGFSHAISLLDSFLFFVLSYHCIYVF